MSEYIIVGCDLHDRSMVLRIAQDREEARTRTYRTDSDARRKMIKDLEREAEEAGARVVFGYEASAMGFGLYDELTEAGMECHVLAPTRLPQTHQSNKRKCDERDAQRILEVLRGHLLAGNELPDVWIPDKQTRDDRELVRTRMDVGDKAVSVCTQIRMLLKRHRLNAPAEASERWSEKFYAWLRALTACESPLPVGAGLALDSLVRQLDALQSEMEQLDKAIRELAQQDRYRTFVLELTKLKGVGVWTAMVFLTEMGDLTRFSNRRQIGAYLGLVPSAFETGETNDRKGHITRQGSPRVRKALCQASWSRVRFDEKEQAFYARVVARNPKHKKIAVVGAMRRLAICMWHRALSAVPVPAADQSAALSSPSMGGEASASGRSARGGKHQPSRSARKQHTSRAGATR